MSTQQPSEEEMRAALEEQMRRITVPDVLIQTVVTLINLGARRLGLAGPPSEAGERDLEQARLAIEGARALLPLLPQEELQPVRDALSQLQMAYAQEVQGAQAGPGDETAAGEGEPGPGPQASPEGQATSEQPASSEKPPSSAADDAERAKARSKIWTPPGS